MDYDELRRFAIRQAMLWPDRFLAAALAEVTDEAIAAELGCPATEIWRLRLADRPRRSHWQADVARIARSVGANGQALGALLRRLGLGPS
jgi:hypothetical protein